MSIFQDILSIFKKQELLFLESCKEADNVYTFLFEKEKDLTWKAGQHGLFQITHKKIKNSTRPFSIASAPSDSVIQLTIGMNENPSDFKKALLELEEGMTLRMSGPVGSFYLEDNRPALFIAGGIGITPFRSMLKQFEADSNASENQMKLLYTAADKLHLFKDELDEIAENTAVNVTYLDSRDILYQEIDDFMNLNKNIGKYFIAGPKSMADSISSYLQNNNVSKRDIKKDAFYGY